MISKLKNRIWIIICWYILIKCFSSNFDLFTSIYAEINYQQLEHTADSEVDDKDAIVQSQMKHMPNLNNIKYVTSKDTHNSQLNFELEDKVKDKFNLRKYAHHYKTNKYKNKNKLMLVSYTDKHLDKLNVNEGDIVNRRQQFLDKKNNNNNDIFSSKRTRYKRSKISPTKTPSSSSSLSLSPLQSHAQSSSPFESSFSFPSLPHNLSQHKNINSYNEILKSEGINGIQDTASEYNKSVSETIINYDNSNVTQVDAYMVINDYSRNMSKLNVQERDLQRHNEDSFVLDELPLALPLRPLIRGPFEEEELDEIAVIYTEQHSPVKINCEVDLDITSSVWIKDGQIIHAEERNAGHEARIIREPRGGLSISNVMLEDNGIWQCKAQNLRGYVENARPIKIIVLDPPKPPYLLIDSRRLDAGNIFVPVKENSELTLACISEGGNPKPILTWEVLLSPGAQKVSSDVLEVKKDKEKVEKDSYRMNTGAVSEAKLPAVYRAHHKARILCVMEHPTLKVRQNASILLDVQYTPSFVLTRTPGFGYPVREGIEVSLKCDVDSNPSSTPIWQKDDSDPPVPQAGDGYLNFTSVRREHAGWYKCTSRHLNFQYSSIGYYLSVRYDSVDVTSEPLEQEYSSHNPYKGSQMEVELGGAVTLQCPQGSLGCWSHLDPITSRLKGLGIGITAPTGQFSLKDVAYQDAGTYKCIGQNPTNRKKLESLHTVSLAVKGAPTVLARNTTPIAFPGSPLHLTVEFCANPPAYAARWLHGDRVYTPGNQYGIDVLAYGFIDLPTPFCKEARLTYVHMHERVPRLFYFIVSSPGGVAEAIFNVNFTFKNKKNINNNMPNSLDEDEELMEPEEIQFPIFGTKALAASHRTSNCYKYILILINIIVIVFLY